nr:MAG TPA: hypothetical protein [Bacteriophage sp.]
MSKYCKAYKLKVTYLDCMECETKECKQTVKKAYLELEPEQTVFVVFASKREGYMDNIVIRCKVKECIVRSNTTLYCLSKEKIVTGQKNLNTFIDNFMCENANIDTGYRGLQIDKYPVFTNKENCIKWLKDL